MEIIRSNKGGAKLCYQGYMYTKHATRKTQQWWKCVKRSSTGCKGSISTSLQNENPTTGQPHNHDPSETNVTYTKARLTMKEQATNTRDKPSQIFAQVVANCNDYVQVMMPRGKLQENHAVPTTNTSSTTVPCWSDNNRRVHWDVSSSAVPTLRQWSRCCQQNACLLYWLQFTATSWCSDPPHGWYFCCCTTSVLTTLHHPSSVQRCDHHFSLRRFLPNKNQDTYRELFQALVDRCQANQLQMAVQTVVTDFEDSVLRAVTAVFGRHIDHQGCFYHLTQATWRRIQQLGLVPFYRQSDDFRLFCGMVDGLAFLYPSMTCRMECTYRELSAQLTHQKHITCSHLNYV